MLGRLSHVILTYNRCSCKSAEVSLYELTLVLVKDVIRIYEHATMSFKEICHLSKSQLVLPRGPSGKFGVTSPAQTHPLQRLAFDKVELMPI